MSALWGVLAWKLPAIGRFWCEFLQKTPSELPSPMREVLTGQLCSMMLAGTLVITSVYWILLKNQSAWVRKCNEGGFLLFTGFSGVMIFLVMYALLVQGILVTTQELF